MGIKNSIKQLRNILFRKGFGTERWKKGFGYFGQNTVIEYPAIIQDKSKIHIGSGTVILNNSRIQNYSDRCDGVGGIFIGENCYLGFHLSLLNSGKIKIGNSVLMAANVLISSENHGMDPESEIPYMDQPLLSCNVEICDGVWIGQNVCILPGVRIGVKAVIGAGSIVTKSVPDYCVAVGNPARVIKRYNFESHRWETV